MALPQLPGNKRHNDSVPEMVILPKKRCMRNGNDSDNCENQQYDVTQSPQHGDQQHDVTQIPGSESRQNDITESPTTKTQQYDVIESPTNKNQEPDFSHLPGLVWTMIMSNLKERDRLVLAVTCQKLYSLCKTRSILWRSAAMHLGNWDHKWSTPQQIELNPTEMSVLQSHSHQIREMTFEIKDLRGLRFSERSLHLLNEAVTKWPLNKMIICCQRANSVSVCPGESMPDNVGHLVRNCLISEKAKGLKQLIVPEFRWTYGDENSVILEALKVSHFTDSLKILSLGPVIISQERRFERKTILKMAECVGRFKNLQTLGLCVPYLSNLVIETLSNSMTRHFKKLIFNGIFDAFHESITKWPQLLSACPDLRVHFAIQFRVNCEDTLAAFPPIVPVEDVTMDGFTDNREHGMREFLKLLPAYSKTLTTLEWLDKSQSDFDRELIDTVKRCPRLFTLTFIGRINSSSINILACMRNWLSLWFLDKSITFPETNTETRAEQMAKLKRILSQRGHGCILDLDLLKTNSEDLSELARPICFKFDSKPVQL